MPKRRPLQTHVLLVNTWRSVTRHFCLRGWRLMMMIVPLGGRKAPTGAKQRQFVSVHLLYRLPSPRKQQLGHVALFMPMTHFRPPSRSREPLRLAEDILRLQASRLAAASRGLRLKWADNRLSKVTLETFCRRLKTFLFNY